MNSDTKKVCVCIAANYINMAAGFSGSFQLSSYMQYPLFLISFAVIFKSGVKLIYHAVAKRLGLPRSLDL
jgi:hypothetical protein